MRKSTWLFLFSLTIAFTSCKPDKVEPTPTNNYAVPSTYTFSNVSYTDQTNILNAMTAFDATGRTATSKVLDAAALKAEFKGSTVANAIDLNALTTTSAQGHASFLLDSLAAISKFNSNLEPSNGKSGVGAYTTPTGTSNYLISGNGINYQQVFSKMMFGTILYNQIALKLSDASIGNSVDNKTEIGNTGTAMQHHWDEAFGFIGISDSFPTVTKGAKYIGNYSNQVNAGTGSNAILMNAFLKGRAAINNNDHTTKQEQANIILNEVERIIAASIIRELNGIKDGLAVPRVNTLLSEGVGFALGLKYGPKRKITDAQINQILADFGTNLYTISKEKQAKIIKDIADIYGFTNTSAI